MLALLALLAGGCASSTAVPSPFPRPGGSGATPALNPELGAAVVATALALRGVPYRPGGQDPSGFDCSGFVGYVLGTHGVRMPRTVEEQFRAGRRIAPREVSAGDLVFFATSRGGASHVGIAVSPRDFVHAPSSTGVVRVERIDAGYWAARFVGARRVLMP